MDRFSLTKTITIEHTRRRGVTVMSAGGMVSEKLSPPNGFCLDEFVHDVHRVRHREWERDRSPESGEISDVGALVRGTLMGRFHRDLECCHSAGNSDSV